MKPQVKRTMVSILAIGTLTALVAGCGTTTGTSSNASSNASSSNSNAASSNTNASASAASSSSNQTLVLYSAQGYDQAMADAFTNATGIKVKLDDASTGPIVSKIEAEKSNPHWDVAWFDGPSTMQALDNQGLLLQNWTPNDISNYTAQGKSLVPSDHAYFPGGITAAAAIGVNTKLVPPSQYPKDWTDLLQPQWKGQVAMNDPAVSGPTFPFVAGMMQLKGTQGGEQFFTQLKANGLKIFRTNGVTLKALLKGQVKAIMIQDSALTSAKAKGDPIHIIYPSSGVFTLPDVVAIDKNAPDMAAAKKFVEFVLSKQGQAVMLNPKNGGGDSYFNPIIQGEKPDPQRQQSGINWFAVNPVQAAKNETQIQSWFHDNIVQ
ncbi:ABC transporter substrate-binding protein [Alicyclobacillus mengziensis]|uniref:Extracellular solute-binding protein n=1 Tax=Alicyclobacillus mengziensis TaxID=2931921 RepID=A0A9X7VZS0_9BACL|nr:extracellular solute-binding protein [Alicyclobacillus mengziensis]QSO48073.1 extracellular solute-binding protein [Alicyclobacillus mengziensis]